MFRNSTITMILEGKEESFWIYRIEEEGKAFRMSSPVFEVDGRLVSMQLESLREAERPRVLANGATEYVWEGVSTIMPSLKMHVYVRLAAHSPVVRFAYCLSSTDDHRLTRITGRDRLQYTSIQLDDFHEAKEICLSDYNELNHSYGLTERIIGDEYFNNGEAVMGPLLTAVSGEHALLLGYEHGSMSPDEYVHYRLSSPRSVHIQAVKGNYCSGQDLRQGYRTLWLQAAAVEGGEQQLAEAYRSFVLNDFSESKESRKPYVFYNTWNYQERNRHWNKKRYLDSLHLARVLDEIEVAHRIGIEVFVIDVGWFEKTGDWKVNNDKFPDRLRQVKAKLEQYGMKLGLWFDPLAAALTSRMKAEYEHCMYSWQGERAGSHPIWETEASTRLCLVSSYGDAFADEMIRLAREIGVRYFKWDGIGQYGCDDPGHHHGDADNSHEERADNHAFQMSLRMADVIRKVTAAVPDAIVDFDVTEGYRSVGLSFLEAGKYFLMNNGPYYPSFDIPKDERDGEHYNVNVFFHPGTARSRICRTTLDYDKWIPSILFLTHYYPDDPIHYQNVAIASLILGHNGIWGDLPAISDRGLEHMTHLLGMYKQVRDDLTAASIVINGGAGKSREIYEKVNEQSGRGAVSIFANAFGSPWDSPRPVSFRYVTQRRVNPNYWCPPNVKVTFDSAGRGIIEASFTHADAAIVYFGVSTKE